MRKKILYISLGFIVLLFAISLIINHWQYLASGLPNKKGSNDIREKIYIGIFQITDHPALDKLRLGFQDYLNKSHKINKLFTIIYDYQNAGGDGTKIEQIANHFILNNPRLIYTIGTACAQSLKNKTAKIPIVMGAVTDPVFANLVKSWERPGSNITGTSDLNPVDIQFDKVHEMIAAASRIGILYNPAEDNSNAILSLVREEIKKRGWTLVERPVNQPLEIPQAVSSLAGKVDIIYAPTDNTVQSGLPSLISRAKDLGIPVFNSDEDSVRKGAIFSIGVDYYQLGIESGVMAESIILGANPAEMPIRRTSKPKLFVNMGTAKRFKIKLPDSFIKEAAKILE